MAIASTLPEVAYAWDSTTGLVAIKRGRMGYNALSREYPNGTEETARPLNERLGVTPAQAKAMKAGSMFGWHISAADPATYEKAAETPAHHRRAKKG